MLTVSDIALVLRDDSADAVHKHVIVFLIDVVLLEVVQIVSILHVAQQPVVQAHHASFGGHPVGL